MSKLLWLTDVHLNFLYAPEAAQTFGECLRQEYECDAAMITGDIAEAPSVRDLLGRFAQGFERPIYFVTGNHDYYHGSIKGVEEALHGILDPNLVWLDAATEPVLLNADTALVGQSGWYDGLLGNAEKSRIIMSDFELIQDFKQYYPGERAWMHDYGARDALLNLLRTLSRKHAVAARMKLLAALKARKYVIFSTHYPPFPGACWYDGALSDSHWMPWFTSAAMGQMLANMAPAYPDNRILVFCGHTHSPGIYQHLPNLIVHTGKARYGMPDISGVLRLGERQAPFIEYV
jgi:predicted MPP superfamily phosphohydrolase